jgi:glycosyltransferase involved in cell wall biosynthesis
VANIHSRIIIAQNLASKSSVAFIPPGNRQKQIGQIRLVFLSRISRMKNLDFALELLTGINANIEFDIFGPIEDQKLWKECQKIIKNLSAKIRVTYRGSLQPDKVIETLSTYHLMVFPTRGENFGHIILESLLAGCPVLISDQTPWRNLSIKGAGWDFPLSDPDKFRDVLRQCIKMDDAGFQSISLNAHKVASDFIQHESMAALKPYRELFETASSK